MGSVQYLPPSLLNVLPNYPRVRRMRAMEPMNPQREPVNVEDRTFWGRLKGHIKRCFNSVFNIETASMWLTVGVVGIVVATTLIGVNFGALAVLLTLPFFTFAFYKCAKAFKNTAL